MEEFANNFDLPHNELLFMSDEPEKGDNYMYKSDASYFMLDTNSRVSYPFTIGFILPYICIIHYVTHNILFPRNRNFINLTRYDIAIV